MARLVLRYRGVRVYETVEGGLEALAGGVLVTGFRGFGAVGYIASTHIAEKLGLERVGYIVTRYMPEFVSMDGSGVTAPFELYASRKHRLVVLVNHDVPVERERDAYAESVILLAKRYSARMGIFLGGFDARFRRGAGERFRWLASGGCRVRFEEPPIDRELYVVGPLALLILYSEIHEFPAVTILPYTETARPDPAAAAIAVEVVGELLGLRIDISDLLDMAKRIEEVLERVEQQRAAEAAPGGASERLYT